LRFEKFSFGSIRIDDGTTYEHDVVIDRGEVSKRKKKPKNSGKPSGTADFSKRGHALEVPPARDRHRHRAHCR